MKITVLIPMHNFPELTHECIRLCGENAGIEHEILVVDDFSEAPFESKFATTIRTKTQSGFTKAVNFGLKALRLDYDYVLLLNNDTIPQPDFLKILVSDMEIDKQIGITGSARQNMEDFVLQMEGADLTTGLVQCTREDIEELRPAVFVPFCSVLLRREMVEEIGLLDERMKNFCSDNDYCLRAVLSGFQVVCDVKSRVKHMQSVTVHSLNLEPWEDQRFFAYKWFGPLMNEVLETIPINYDLNKWGRIGFRYEAKEKEKKIILPGDLN